MKKLFGFLAALAVLSCTTANAQMGAGGISKGNKHQSWKFADSIPASTIALFPSYVQNSADTTPVLATQFYSEFELDTLATTYTKVNISAAPYFKGGERLLLTLPVSDTAHKVVLYQPLPNRYDTLTADKQSKSVEFFYDLTKFKVISK